MKRGMFLLLLGLLAGGYFEGVNAQGVQGYHNYPVRETNPVLYCFNCHNGKFAVSMQKVKREIKHPEDLWRLMKKKNCWGYGTAHRYKAKELFKGLQEVKDVDGGSSKHSKSESNGHSK